MYPSGNSIKKAGEACFFYLQPGNLILTYVSRKNYRKLEEKDI
jgi:hypothetical protein